MDSDDVSKEPGTNNGLQGVKVPLHELIASLGLPGDAKKQLKRIKKNQKVLEEGLPTFEQIKICGAIGYERSVKEMNKWEPQIKENRKSKVIFPENSVGFSVKLTPPVGKITKPQTPMEEQVAQLLQTNKDFLPEKRPLSVAEERALKAKSLEEAQMLRAELLKQKALLSYYNAKMKRQNKIKSKGYRKILRKAREGNKARLMELTKDKDPEAYREWLKREERKQIEERMTQKHGHGSRAMAKKVRYAKYDEKSRAVVQDMNDIRKELTKKIPSSVLEDLDDDDEDAYDNNAVEIYNDDAGDGGIRISKEVTLGKRPREDSDESSDEEESAMEESGVSKEHQEMEEEHGAWEKVCKRERSRRARKKRKLVKEPEVNINPLAFNKVEKDLMCGGGGVDLVVENQESLGDKEARKRLTIAEAFEDDNIIEEFVREKKETIEEDKPKDVVLALEGWGCWAGLGISMLKRKKRRFTIKAPVVPRKDQNLPNVIISETKDTAITKHQVSSLPHPFRNVVEFERRIKKPIGKQWNPESKYRQLIQPNVATRLGAVIQPISSDAIRKPNR